MRRKLLRWWSIIAIALGARGVLALAAPPPLPPPLLQSASTWVNATGNLAKMASVCGNLTMLSPVPGSDIVIAGVAQRGLWANRNGNTWSPLGAGAGSATIGNRPLWIAYDPAHPGVFWESGIYEGNAVYKTADNGTTFQKLGSLTHSDYVSVDFGDPDRNTLLASGHEQSRAVWRSTDGGQTWTNIGLTLPANSRQSSHPQIIDSRTYVVNSQGSGGEGYGIYRTTNAGASWQQVSALGPSGPPLVASNGAIYWPFGNSLLKSVNAGATWTQVGSNLQTVHPIELPNGRLVSLGPNNLVISADGGATWTPSGPALPYAPSGLIYSVRRQAFFIWRGDCGNFVLPDAVMRLEVVG